MMLLTKEDIENHTKDALSVGPLYDKHGGCQIDSPEFLELCNLALIGLAVQPRPIEELPDPTKDKKKYFFLLHNGGPKFGPQDRDWWINFLKSSTSTNDYIGHIPKYWYDLSALPKPNT
jgi:hypothetical protein